jgi:sortase B
MRKAIGRFLVFMSVFIIIAIGYIVWHQHGLYKEGTDVYNEIRNKATDFPDRNLSSRKEQSVPFRVDWEALANTDTVAWIRFDNPEIINYPVMQGKDNVQYLNHLYNGEYSINGSIFINCHNDKYFKDDNTIIYGHSMLNGDMFGSLKKYHDDSFGRENPYFYIYLPDGTTHKYQIFAVVDAGDGSDDYRYSFSDISAFKTFQKTMKSKSLYDTGLTTNFSKRLVSLSTCASSGADTGKRIMVIGMEISRVKTQDAASWYKAPKSIK